MLPAYFPTFIFALINIVVFLAIIAVIIKAIQGFKNHISTINKIGKNLDKIIDSHENKQ